MKSDIRLMLAAFAAASFLMVSPSTFARDLNVDLNCRSTPHSFIASLENDRSIEPAPMRVESNSVNAFRPTHSGNLTAFGFKIYAVVGYEQGDTIFKKGSGQAIDGSMYGAVVSGSVETVEAQIRKDGSSAIAKQVVPLLLTAIVCKAP